MLDAIVVGLGPAGSIAAYTLAKSGLRVLAFDRERFPRYKSCGGCISAKVEGLLDFDFSPVIEETVRGATFTYKSGSTMDILSDSPVGYNVMRDSFDDLLMRKAAGAGAEVIEGCRISGFIDNNGSITVAAPTGKRYTARFLIGADGASGLIGRAFGLNL
ncbi:MAG: FAD-dependent monooxygenase, partial [Deltaproteobacteria bacterium]|nr:FAD-dependent monooxygenase [Deltaproteobacteria bacterium]